MKFLKNLNSITYLITGIIAFIVIFKMAFPGRTTKILNYTINLIETVGNKISEYIIKIILNLEYRKELHKIARQQVKIASFELEKKIKELKNLQEFNSAINVSNITRYSQELDALEYELNKTVSSSYNLLLSLREFEKSRANMLKLTGSNSVRVVKNYQKFAEVLNAQALKVKMTKSLIHELFAEDLRKSLTISLNQRQIYAAYLERYLAEFVLKQYCDSQLEKDLDIGMKLSVYFKLFCNDLYCKRTALVEYLNEGSLFLIIEIFKIQKQLMNITFHCIKFVITPPSFIMGVILFSILQQKFKISQLIRPDLEPGGFMTLFMVIIFFLNILDGFADYGGIDDRVKIKQIADNADYNRIVHIRFISVDENIGG